MSFSGQIISHIAKELKVKESLLDEDTGIGDIPEWDSLANIRLILSIENKYNISIDAEDALEIETIADLIDFLEENIKLD